MTPGSLRGRKRRVPLAAVVAVLLLLHQAARPARAEPVVRADGLADPLAALASIFVGEASRVGQQIGLLPASSRSGSAGSTVATPAPTPNVPLTTQASAPVAPPPATTVRTTPTPQPVAPSLTGSPAISVPTSATSSSRPTSSSTSSFSSYSYSSPSPSSSATPSSPQPPTSSIATIPTPATPPMSQVTLRLPAASEPAPPDIPPPAVNDPNPAAQPGPITPQPDASPTSGAGTTNGAMMPSLGGTATLRGDERGGGGGGLEAKGFDPANGAFLGGTPDRGVDLPVTAVFLLLFLAGAITHISIYTSNSRRGHKFLLSDLMFDFSMVRVVTCVFRIAWIFAPLKGVILTAVMLQNGGAAVAFAVNIIFAQRIVRSLHPKFGWRRDFSIVTNSLAISVPVVVLLQMGGTIGFFFSVGHVGRLHMLQDLLRTGTAWVLFLGAVPVLILGVADGVPGPLPEPFGAGDWRLKKSVVMAGGLLLVPGAAVRLAVSLNPEPPSAMSPLFGHATFYTTQFMLELLVIVLYAATRVDLLFHVPDGSSRPGDYSGRNAPAGSGARPVVLRGDVEESLHGLGVPYEIVRRGRASNLRPAHDKDVVYAVLYADKPGAAGRRGSGASDGRRTAEQASVGEARGSGGGGLRRGFAAPATTTSSFYGGGGDDDGADSDDADSLLIIGMRTLPASPFPPPPPPPPPLPRFRAHDTGPWTPAAEGPAAAAAGEPGAYAYPSLPPRAVPVSRRTSVLAAIRPRILRAAAAAAAAAGPAAGGGGVGASTPRRASYVTFDEDDSYYVEKSRAEHDTIPVAYRDGGGRGRR